MRNITTISTTDGVRILIESEGGTAPPDSGVVKTGIKDAIATATATIEGGFEVALGRVLQGNVHAFMAAIQTLSTPPTELEITFGLKVAAELGGFIVSKLTSDANYTVKLSWKSLPPR